MFNHHNSPFALPFASKGEKYEREREKERKTIKWPGHTTDFNTKLSSCIL
jgi:hypothetical protein